MTYKYIFFFFTTLLLIFPILIRSSKNKKINLRDPIYILLTGLFFYLVVGQLDSKYVISNIFSSNQTQYFSEDTEITAMIYVFLTILYFVCMDYYFKDTKAKSSNIKKILIKKKELLILFLTLFFIANLFFYLNLSRFGNIFNFIYSDISKGLRYYIIKSYGNYPFDIFFYLSFVYGVVLLNMHTKNILKSIILVSILFLPYFFYMIYMFDRSGLLKYAIVIIFFFIFNKKIYLKLKINKVNLIIFISLAIITITFSKIGEIRKDIIKLIRDNDYEISTLINKLKSNQNPLREFKNVNYGFLFMIENTNSINQNINLSYNDIIYNNVPGSFLRKINNSKESNKLSIIENNITNHKSYNEITRSNPVSIANHPLAEAYYNFKDLAPIILATILFVIYKAILWFQNINYFLYYSSIIFYPTLFLLWRSNLSSTMTIVVYFIISIIILKIINLLFKIGRRSKYSL
jgi:hypothetical protein